METDLHKLTHQSAPLDPPLTRREMFVTVPSVVVNMKHPEVGTEFVDKIVEIPGEKSVTGVQAGSDIICIERAKNPDDVAGTAKKQVWEFIFQNTFDSGFGAAHGNSV